jgi:dipeptidase E
LKLYLSSYRHGHDADVLRGLVGKPGTAAVIFNACDGFGEDRLQKLPRERDDLKDLGFECEELDLRVYFEDFDGLCARVALYDLLWVVGGNAFVLAKAMTASRFAEAVDEPIVEERLVYAGYSAGTCAAAPDLEGIQLMDDPTLLPDGYPATATATTLAWVPWRIVPHWRSDHPAARDAERAVEYLVARNLAFRTLQDGQAIIVEGGHSRII